MFLFPSIFTVFLFFRLSVQDDPDPPFPPRNPPKIYAAIGDSWASGMGAGDVLDVRCARFSDSYPEQFNRHSETKASKKFQDLTCAGASLEEVSRQVQYIDPDADLISVSVGLQFVGINPVLDHCDEHPQRDCTAILDTAIGIAFWDNPGAFYHEMLALVRVIKRQAPRALIVLLGFPRFYGSPVRNCDPSGGGAQTYPYRDRINKIPLFLNRQFSRISDADDLILDVVAKNPDDAFTNHRYCDSDPWLQPYRNPKPPPGKSEYREGYLHPNAAGHTKYADLLREAWNTLMARSGER